MSTRQQALESLDKIVAAAIRWCDNEEPVTSQLRHHAEIVRTALSDALEREQRAQQDPPPEQP